MVFKDRSNKMTIGDRTVESRPPPLVVGGMEIHPPKHKKIGGHRLRSLVVDDDNTILKCVAQMLTLLGCQVDTAQEKPEVMNKVTNSTYDLLVTDLEMPGINGYHLTQRIKKEMHETKAIIMTGRSEVDCLEMMATRWVDGWLFKPFGLKELRAMLKWLGLLAD
jgi:CheY-like chemotaxis protein